MSLKRLGFYLLLSSAAVTFIYPFLWMASQSLKPAFEQENLALYSSHFTLDNYRAVFSSIPIGWAFFNSSLVALCATTSVLFFSSLAGFALARLPFKGRELMVVLVTLTMMVPGQLTLIPLYRLIVAVGWMDTYWALIVPSAVSGLGVLIFRQTFMTIPVELVEAARMEGAGELLILRKIFWPLSKPALVTVGILTFMGSWNEILWPLMVIRDQRMMTMPQMVALFVKGGQAGGDMGVELAAAMLLVVPIVVGYSIFQRYFIESIATSGIKG